MRKSNFALRLQPSLLEEARKLANTEGVTLIQLINVAVAENALRFAHGELYRGTGRPEPIFLRRSPSSIARALDAHP